MRFSLTTFLLSLTSIALAIGWLAERQSYEINRESICESEMVCARVWRAHQTGVTHLHYGTWDTEESIKADVIGAVLLLCRQQALYDQSELQPYSSVRMGNSLLGLLQCDSPDNFRSLALSLYRFKTEVEQEQYRKQHDISVMGSYIGAPKLNEEHYPELHDTTSDEYNELSAFIRNAISNGDAE